MYIQIDILLPNQFEIKRNDNKHPIISPITISRMRELPFDPNKKCIRPNTKRAIDSQSKSSIMRMLKAKNRDNVSFLMNSCNIAGSNGSYYRTVSRENRKSESSMECPVIGTVQWSFCPIIVVARGSHLCLWSILDVGFMFNVFVDTQLVISSILYLVLFPTITFSCLTTYLDELVIVMPHSKFDD